MSSTVYPSSRILRISSISSSFSAGLNPAAGSSRQSSFGLGRQRAGDLQPPLVAVGQVAAPCPRPGRRCRRTPAAPWPRSTASRSSRRWRGEPEQRAGHARPVPGVGADDDVLQRGHLAEQPDVLERAGDAELGDLVLLAACRAAGPRAARPRRSAGRRPVIALKQVVLPAPFGPIRPRISPRWMSKVTSSSAVRPPNLTVRSSTSSSVLAHRRPRSPGPGRPPPRRPPRGRRAAASSPSRSSASGQAPPPEPGSVIRHLRGAVPSCRRPSRGSPRATTRRCAPVGVRSARRRLRHSF